ncbi:MAG: DUF3072 domain-containing protein [Planctomycetes bacterium]|nr:DUF3072 domain-containing protein [Planctomycetota bacterium]
MQATQNRDTSKHTTTIRIKDKHGNVVEEIEVVTYKGLLAMAHEAGLKSVRTTLLQAPAVSNDDTAIVAAIVMMDDERDFHAIGDASPRSVTKRIEPHLIRMAETRAKARAFRDALSISEVSLEELSDEVDFGGSRNGGNRSGYRGNGNGGGYNSGNHGNNRSRQNGGNGRGANNRRSSGPELMTDAQRRYLFRLASEQGITGDAATDYLCENFRVNDLEQITKADASDMIDRWTNGGGNGAPANAEANNDTGY